MQPNYNAGYSTPQEYGQPPQTVPQQQLQTIIIQQCAPASAAQAVVIGRFAPHYEFGLSKVMGDLLLTAGVFTIVGAALEVLTFRIFIGLIIMINGTDDTESLNNACEAILTTASLNSYSGFWCGALMIICGSIVISGPRCSSRRDSTIIALLISAGIGLVFSIVVLAMSAAAMNGNYSYCIKHFAPSHAAYGIMIGFGCLGLLFSLVIILLGIKALVVGFGLISATTLPSFNRQKQSAPVIDVVQGQQNYGYVK